jgi:hypothetical protein
LDSGLLLGGKKEFGNNSRGEGNAMNQDTTPKKIINQHDQLSIQKP